MPAARRAALVISVVASACVALAGCSGSSSSSGGTSGSGGSASGGPNQPAGFSSSPPTVPIPNSNQLTGKFCDDFKSVGAHVTLPANATGSLSDLQKHGVPAINQVAAYFDGLAAEAPAKPAQALRVIAADYKALATSISSGNSGSVSKAVSQMQNLTTNGSSGNAFRELISYMVTKCRFSA
jgi:hypothetical protein